MTKKEKMILDKEVEFLFENLCLNDYEVEITTKTKDNSFVYKLNQFESFKKFYYSESEFNTDRHSRIHSILELVDGSCQKNYYLAGLIDDDMSNEIGHETPEPFRDNKIA